MDEEDTSVKKYILVLLVGLFANSAMASKARLLALGVNADQTGVGYSHDGTLLFKDNRNIFLNPGQVGTMGNSFNFEMGSSTAITPNAEGGIIYDFEGGKLGFQLGRRHEITRTMSGLGSTILPNDSVDIIWGQKGSSSWGFGLHYADSKTDAASGADAKASVVALSAGMVKDKIEFFGTLGLDGKAERTTAAATKYEGKAYIKAGVGYTIDNTSKVIGSVLKSGFDWTSGAKTEFNTLGLDVRYARTHKPKTDLMFFYGGGFTNVSGDRTTGATKTDVTVQQIPLFLGIEGSANSWLDLRASVIQALLLNTQKNENAGSAGEKQHSPNSTAIGAGATLKFTNFMLDATLAGNTTGAINATTLLANASIIYNF